MMNLFRMMNYRLLLTVGVFLLLVFISLSPMAGMAVSKVDTSNAQVDVDDAPMSTTISGTVLKLNTPIQSKRIELVQNDIIITVVETDAAGKYSFAAEVDVEYELRGFGDTSAGELHEWVILTTPSSTMPNISLPTIEIGYDGLLSPVNGASYAQDEINADNPIVFSWSPRSDAIQYNVFLRKSGHWSQFWRLSQGTSTTAEFDGMIDGQQISPMDYDWHIGMSLDNGWWVWSEHRQLVITGEQIEASIAGTVTKQGADAADKYIKIYDSDEVLQGSMRTDTNGNYSFSDIVTGAEYEIQGFGNESQNELHEWVMRVTPTTAEPDISLPSVDIWYDGLLSPANGATYHQDEIDADTPIVFYWSPRSDAIQYNVFLRKSGHWSQFWRLSQGTSTTAEFDGMIDGQQISPMDYDWHIGMSLDNGWWVWSEHRQLVITGEQAETVYLPVITNTESATK